ncbi:MAG: TlpA family protein disulfide reductase [Candidatus Polarisedimenticolaceae bacterium]|nr:TlpA family protein disulfide reductase [Candidatus Polarisedimenticolaceae bacterium]
MAVRIFIYLFAGILLAVAIWAGSEAFIPGNSTANKGQEIPSFQLPDLNDEMQNQDSWLGKVVVLNFWAVWCPPCRAEMPEFIELQKEYGERGLQFVGIAIDSKEVVQNFTQMIGVNYPILIGDTNDMIISKKLGNRFEGLPFTAIFDRQGKLIHTQIGQISPARIIDKIAPFL